MILSFGKTIDTFQGQNAGPVDEGKPPNTIQRIICDPGNRSFEAQKPGLFFTQFSRGTTLGNKKDGKRMDSAVYFYDFGLNTTMTPSRITDLRHSPSTGKIYQGVMKRDRWIQHLTANVHKSGLTEDAIEGVFAWAKAKRVSTDQLDMYLNMTTWRCKKANDIP